MDRHSKPAPGAPGQFSPWTSGAKTGIGRALNPGSEISFTIGKGTLNEVYFPREDMACIRHCVFVVTDGEQFFSDERLHTRRKQRTAARGVPAYTIRARCPWKKYSLQKEIIADPQRNTVLQRIRFRPSAPGLRLYCCLTPHLANNGAASEAWIDDYKGMQMLFAASGGLFLAMACDSGWNQSTVGFIGASDGYSALQREKRLTDRYTYAGKGNVELCAEPVPGRHCVIAIGFGYSPEDAAHQARSSLLYSYKLTRDQYIREWKEWHRSMSGKRKKHAVKSRYLRESAAALRISESRHYPGAIIASLSVPWGQLRGVNHGLGYHLVWPRDLVECAWGFLALDAGEDVLRILNYLFATQDEDGKWAQNMWLDGRPCLDAVQLDQVALPLLLLHSCFHHGLIDGKAWRRYLPGIDKAATYLLDNGPFSQQDRWEQIPGLSTFTLAAEIAALRAIAGLFDHHHQEDIAARCRETADDWDRQIETWTFARDTEKTRLHGVDGYYIRINPFFAPLHEVKDKTIRIHHHPGDTGTIAVGDIVSVDALALVRFGVRRADDPRIRDTLRVIDAELKQELPAGPCWRRFSKDGYGEDDAGNPFETIGTGRSWPLLTGERAHYEIAAGNYAEAYRLFHAMEGFSYHGLFPEQVWDGPDLPEKGLFRGQYTSSAMPLSWAQAEYIKLAVSLRNKKVFDLPVTATDR
jgi:glucoamylase